MSGEVGGRGAAVPPAGKGRLAAAWALAGVVALFTSAVIRLGGRGVETIRAGLAPLEWGALLVLTVLFVYGEGVRTFHMRWVPRLVARARSLRSERLGLQCLGPLYGMSLVSDSRAGLIRAWSTTLAIVTAIVVVRRFPEPWRGIVDFAVAAALLLGIASIVLRGRAALED